VAAVEKEEARLGERKERHARQRRAAYRRMVSGGEAEGEVEETAEAVLERAQAEGKVTMLDGTGMCMYIRFFFFFFFFCVFFF